MKTFKKYRMVFEVASPVTSKVLCKYLLFSARKGTLLGWFTLYLYSGKTINFKLRKELYFQLLNLLAV